MSRIGFLGAFSIDNAGDAIVGLAGRQALAKRIPSAQQVVLSPQFPHPFWNHAWDEERGLGEPIVQVPATDDVSWAEGLDALVIGGGGIVNLDPSFRPFLLGRPDEWSADRPAVWNAVGAQNQPSYLTAHQRDYDRIRRCCEALSYVSVRNHTTERLVRACGYNGDLHVVPDPSLCLDVPDTVRGEVEATLSEAGVDTGRPLLGLSLAPLVKTPNSEDFVTRLIAEIRGLQRAPHNVEVVLFPFSYMQGDAAMQQQLTSVLPSARVIGRRLGALHMWALVGRMDVHVGCRFHSTLAAFAQDTPFVAVDTYLRDAVASSKIREFIVDSGLEAHYVCPFLPEASVWKIGEMVRARDRVSFASTVTSQRQRLEAHFDTLVEALAVT